jgi:hypothetical protein
MARARAVTLLAAAMAISPEVAAQAACDPAAGLTFICGLTNAEDLVQVYSCEEGARRVASGSSLLEFGGGCAGCPSTVTRAVG